MQLISLLQQSVNSLHEHNKVDFDKSKRVCYLFAIFMPISKAFCIAALLTVHTGHFIMFSVITNIYNQKTKGPTLMEFFTDTGKLKKFFLTTGDV